MGFRQALLPPILIVLAASAAAAQSVTRIEQNDPSVVYSGNWYTNTSTGNTAGLAALTNTRGSRVSLTFNGTGINWIGASDAWAGLATVYVDGAMTIVDTYNRVGQYQKVLYSKHGLAAGPHSISIEVMHERGPGTDGSWVWIDAFDIENGEPIPGGVAAPAGHVEDNDPALVFSGRWYSKIDPIDSGGSAVLAMDPGFRLTINFRGTGIRWIGYRDEWSGLAHVYVDGEARTTVDTYAAPAQARAVLYTIDGLPAGAHSLTIEATGTHNANSKASWVWVDAFDIAP